MDRVAKKNVTGQMFHAMLHHAEVQQMDGPLTPPILVMDHFIFLLFLRCLSFFSCHSREGHCY